MVLLRFAGGVGIASGDVFGDDVVVGVDFFPECAGSPFAQESGVEDVEDRCGDDFYQRVAAHVQYQGVEVAGVPIGQNLFVAVGIVVQQTHQVVDLFGGGVLGGESGRGDFEELADFDKRVDTEGVAGSEESERPRQVVADLLRIGVHDKAATGGPACGVDEVLTR